MKTNLIQPVSHALRRERLQQRGCTIWLTGLSAAGKSTVALHLEHLLFAQGAVSFVLDADKVRNGLSRDLGFSAIDRMENIRRCGEVAKLFASAGIITIMSFISPYKADRQWARELHQDAGLPFFECFVDAPLAVCKRRDPKGLYKKAMQGELKQFTGIDDPYEKPTHPDLHLRTDRVSAEESAQALIDLLTKNAVLNVSELLK